MKKIVALFILFLLPAWGANPGFSLDAFAEKAEKSAADVGKELNWSSKEARKSYILNI